MNDNYLFTEKFALEQDAQDSLKHFRNFFLFPQHDSRNVIYFCGNSLGLQPVATQKYIQQELDDWANHAVEAHFTAKNPWVPYHEMFAQPLAKLTGALPEEVVAMNQLTSNIHFLFVSFYRPTKERYKILCEAGAFPSDRYAIESQVKFHGLNPDNAIIELSPRVGEHAIRHEDILSAIEKNKNELALIFIGGVNYYSGQVFDMKSITEAGHKAEATVGFDLAHAIGNIKLSLQDWNVDFAVWCTYKYLNSGPGSVGGVYIHERHAKNISLPRFAGWWGHDKANRFKMEKDFRAMPTAEGWQLSNAPVLSMAAHKAALDIFDEAGMDALIEKSIKLTGYLEFVIGEVNKKIESGNWRLEIITPRERGCQLSIIAHGLGKALHEKLSANGVMADWREPNVIRCAPVPLYNSFEDIYRFGEIILKIMERG
ncbi:MAG TPA: kynureninase [Bacteroidia bacterium]|nr:kynureninase [Bacteroidia bacterium]